MTTTSTASLASTAESTLRQVLRINTGLSVATGMIGLVLAGPAADVLGVEQVWLVRLLGAGLLGFAGVVFLVARSSSPVLQRWSLEISLGDIGWAAGTVVVIALGWLSTAGALIMAVIGLGVLGLGLAQYHFRREMAAAG